MSIKYTPYEGIPFSEAELKIHISEQDEGEAGIPRNRKKEKEKKKVLA